MMFFNILLGALSFKQFGGLLCIAVSNLPNQYNKCLCAMEKCVYVRVRSRHTGRKSLCGCYLFSDVQFASVASQKHHSCGLVKDIPMASAALQKRTHTHTHTHRNPAGITLPILKSMLTESVIYISDEAQKL